MHIQTRATVALDYDITGKLAAVSPSDVTRTASVSRLLGGDRAITGVVTSTKQQDTTNLATAVTRHSFAIPHFPMVVKQARVSRGTRTTTATSVVDTFIV